MPPLPFLVFELGVFALGAICAIHAWRTGPYMVFALLGSVGYSLAAEAGALHGLREYYYNNFLVMICPSPNGGWGVNLTCNATYYCVPLCIPIMEAIIIYAVMRTSDLLGLPWLLRPVYDGLLALSIDLIMDPIVSLGLQCSNSNTPSVAAPGLGLWVWELNSTEEVLLGVDLNNFAGWLLSIMTFSLMLRLGRRLVPPGSKGPLMDALAAFLAVPATVAAFVVEVKIYTWIDDYVIGPEWIQFSLLVGIFVLAVWRFAREVQRDNPVDRLALAIPLFFYLYSLSGLLLFGVYSARPVLLALWAVAFTLGAVAYTWPYWNRIFPPVSAKSPI
jgi:hypothetical protein